MRPVKQENAVADISISIRGYGESLAEYRSDMLRFATLQLQDDSLAEDVVQEALASALDGLSTFKRQAQLKTWLFSILKNKIIDALRERQKSNLPPKASGEMSDDQEDSSFDSEGNWQPDSRPSDWGNPQDVVANKQLQAVLELCIDRLPDSLSRIFLMREVLALSTDEICKELNISQENCWTTLHRARSRLRACVQEKWFAEGGVGHAL